jgi:hypothetical protein
MNLHETDSHEQREGGLERDGPPGPNGDSHARLTTGFFMAILGLANVALGLFFVLLSFFTVFPTLGPSPTSILDFAARLAMSASLFWPFPVAILGGHLWGSRGADGSDRLTRHFWAAMFGLIGGLITIAYMLGFGPEIHGFWESTNLLPAEYWLD